MTKDGRPSLITDIRLFVGNSSTDCSYLKNHEEGVAFGRRMGFYLNGEGFSLGSFPALYVLFTSAEEDGSVRVADDLHEWWFRFVRVGVPENFPDVPNASEIVQKGVTATLLAVRPDQTDVVRRADAVVRRYGKDLRFLLQRREMAKLVLEISFNIEAWPRPSFLFISQTDKATGVYQEADPIPLGFYDEGFDLISGIRLQDGRNFEVKTAPPFMSQRVKRPG